jgi:large repetitive protein
MSYATNFLSNLGFVYDPPSSFSKKQSWIRCLKNLSSSHIYPLKTIAFILAVLFGFGGTNESFGQCFPCISENQAEPAFISVGVGSQSGNVITTCNPGSITTTDNFGCQGYIMDNNTVPRLIPGSTVYYETGNGGSCSPGGMSSVFVEVNGNCSNNPTIGTGEVSTNGIHTGTVNVPFGATEIRFYVCRSTGGGNPNICNLSVCSIDLSATTTTPISCVDATDGTITAVGLLQSTIPGTGLTYSLTLNGAPVGTPNTTGLFTGLAAGTYVVTVNDGNGCVSAAQVAVGSSIAPCCQLTVQCPSDITTAFSCTNPIPPAAMNEAEFEALGADIGNSPCGTLSITSMTSTLNNCSSTLVTRTYTISDDATSTNCVQTIAYSPDITPPSIVCPANTSVAYTCASALPAASSFSVTDNCGGTYTATLLSQSAIPSPCPNGIVTRIYGVSDNCGNSATCSQTLIINDNVAPAIVCPANTSVAYTCASALPAASSFSVTDNCGGTFTATLLSQSAIPSPCPNGTVTRIYGVSDNCGNSATCSQTLIINDNVAPDIVCPANTSVAYTCVSALPPTSSFSVTDNCGGTFTATLLSQSAIPSPCPNGIVTRIYGVSDACSNSATCSQTLIINDNIAPVIVCPASTTVAYTCASALPAASSFSVTDNCGGTFSATLISQSTIPSPCPNGTVTRIYGVSDNCGNSATCSQTLIINDNVAPVVTCPANTTATCVNALPSANATLTITDACSGTTTATATLISTSPAVGGICADRGTVTRIYQAADPCGNTATCSQTIAVFDNVAPVLTCPANTTATCVNALPFANATLTITDACSGTTTASATLISTSPANGGICANRGTVTRIYQAADPCGNTATCSQTIVVFDNVAPVLTCPANTTTTCVNALPSANATLTISDACSGTTTASATFSDAFVGSCPNRGTVTRTYTAADPCGNAATCAQTIVVFDNVLPTITCPANTSVSCASAIPAPTPLTVVSSDNCGEIPTNTHVGDVNTNMTCANRFTVNRTYRATDACGNSQTCLQLILVNDVISPIITCPAIVTLTCSNQIPPALPFTGTTSDNCGGAVTVTNIGQVIVPGTCHDPLTYFRDYKATDVCGNTATCQQIIQIQPRFSRLPANLTMSACWNQEDYMDWIHNHGGALVECVTENYTWEWEQYDYVQLSCPNLRGWSVRFTATDIFGAVVCATATVTIVDDGAPIWDMLPMDKTVNCADVNANASIQMWLANYGGAWLLDCGTQNNLLVTNNYNSSTANQCGATTVVFTATDNCGNSSTASAILTSVDNTPPVITNVPANVTINCPATPTFAAPTATDACSSATLTFTDAATGSCPAGYTITRTWVARDACGNSSTATSRITVNGTNPPNPTGILTFNCTNNQIFTAPFGSTGIIATYVAPTASSTCTVGSVTVTRTSGLASGSVFPVGVSTVIYTATDGCGNTKTCSLTVTVNAGTPPNPTGVLTLNCPVNQTITAATGANSAIVTFASPTGTSTCTVGNVSTSQTGGLASGSAFPVGVSTVTFTATDGCGNVKTCSFTVTVNAGSPPNPTGVLTLTCGNNQIFTAASGTSSTVVNYNVPTASSTCTVGSVSTTRTSGLASGSSFPLGVSTIVYTSTDGCGNVKTCSFTVTVNAGVPPNPTGTLTLNTPPNQSLGCGQTAQFGTATASSTCTTGSSNVTFVDATTGSACTGFTSTRTFTATDGCGNTKTGQQVITIAGDASAPSFTSLPNSSTVACGAAITFGSATANDLCGSTASNVPVTFVDLAATGSCSAGYTYRRVFTATDACGKTSTAVQTITTSPDNVGPTFTSLPPVDLMIDCDDPVNVGNASAADACTPNGVTVTHVTTTNAGATGCNTVNGITYGYDVYTTWTAKDACGNLTTAQTNVWVIPDGMAFLAIPDNKTANCGQPMPAWDDAPMVKSTFGPIMTTTFEDIYDLNACGAGTVSRLWTATDDLGNTAHAMQVITVMPDTELPQIFISEPTSTVNCDEFASMSAPVVSDNCAAVDQLLVEFTDVKVGNTITRTWIVTDLCGNKNEAIQTIITTDNIAPVFATTLTNKTISCSEIMVFDTPTATDDCSDVILSFVDNAAVNACQTLHTRTWTAMDVSGNVKTTQQILTVVDNIAPVFSFVPADQTLQCGTTPTTETAIANDNCTAANLIVVNFTDVKVGNIITRTWTATDACGNVKEAVQIITSTDDLAPSFVSLLTDKVISCDETLVFDTPIASDDCSTPNLTFVDAVQNDVCQKVHTRTWTATDASGNIVTTQQSITVNDTNAPVFGFVPSDIILDCAELIVFGTPTATDLCGLVTITQNDSETTPTCGNSGQTITRTWTAVDECGNKMEASQSITIAEDVIAPTFTEQITSTLEMTTAEFASWQPSNLTSENNCNEAVTVIASTLQIDACNYDVTYTASDLCGNTTAQVQKIHITDGACSPTGTNGIEEGSYRIYPNPATSRLFIQSINNGLKVGTRYQVVDNLGRILLTGTLLDNLTELNISKLPDANYTLRIENGLKPIVLMFEKMNK